MSKKILTKNLSITTASEFVDKIQSNESFYVFAGKHVPYSNSDQVIETPTNSVDDITISVFDDMVFGKKIGADDVIEMIPRYDWSLGAKFDMYDDQDSSLYEKRFYTSVSAGSQYHVYKCLSNGNNNPSTVQPSGTDLTPFESPSDGYIWKYMYSANSVVMSKFATNDYIPIVANSAVRAAAVSGSIDVIKIEDPGIGYDNYLVDFFRSASDIYVDGSPLLYSIGPNASILNDFYNGCIIYITSGAAQGEYSIITNYYISGDKKIIEIDNAFENKISVNDTFEIYPFVYVFDTGGIKQSNCIARAIISNTSGNSVSKIDVIQPGSYYRSATATIIPANVVAVAANASLRAIISPQNGHGYDSLDELGANHVAISVKFAENEEILSTENDYRQIGIISQPLFANVTIQTNVANTIGNFIVGERVFEYRPIKIAGTVSVNSNTTVIGTSTEFSDAIKAGDQILINSGSSNMFANVLSVANNTLLTIAANATFTGSNCTLSILETSFRGFISSKTMGEIVLSNVSTSNMLATNKFIGENSFSTTEANTSAPIPIAINGRASNNFNTFNQLTKFIGNLTGSTQFIEDETVVQSSTFSIAQPSANFHSYVENGAADEMFVSRTKNIFRTSSDVGSDGIITGLNSSATFTVTAKYNGELVPDSGKVLYLENLNPISRANTQTETIKIIISF